MIRLLDDTDKELVSTYLETHHMDATYLIGNIEFGVANRPEIARSGDYYGYFQREVLKGVIQFCNIGSCVVHFKSDEAVPHFSTLMRQREITVLMGVKQVVFPLYQEMRGFKDVAALNESLYLVNRVLKPFVVEGVVCTDVIGHTDPEVVEFMVRADRIGFGRSRTEAEAIRALTTRNREHDYLMLRVKDRIVAQAAVQVSTSRLSQIGAVFTDPNERGKGYCKAVVSELTDRIHQSRKLPTLWVRTENTPAVRAYTSIGYEYYGDYLMVKFQ